MYLASIFVAAILTTSSILITNYNLSDSDVKELVTKKNCFLVFASIIIFFLSATFLTGLNKVLINLLVVFILILCLFSNYNYKNAIFYTVTYYVICSISEVISAIICNAVLNININDYNNMKYGIIFFSILNFIITIIISYSGRLRSFVLKVYYKIDNKNFIYLFLIIVYMLLLTFNNKKNLGNNIEFYTNMGMFFFVIISIIFVSFNTIKRIKYENEYEVLQKSLSMYEKEVNRQGKKNHEYNNQLMVLKGYSNNPKKLNEYLDLLIEEHKGGQNFMIKQLGYLPDGGFKGLIYSKLALMEEKGIKSFLYVSSDLKKFLENIDIKYYSDLTKMFGIFVDNAIDAASIAKKKEVVIDIKSEEDYLVIDISNTFNDKIDINKVGKKGFTSKGLGHGFGLSIVKDIKNSRDLIDTYTEVDKDMFKQTILAKIK